MFHGSLCGCARLWLRLNAAPRQLQKHPSLPRPLRHEESRCPDESFQDDDRPSEFLLCKANKMAKPVDNRAAPGQLLCSARHTRSAKPTAMRSAAGQPCLPFYTRSLPQHFEKQSALRRTLTETRQGSWQNTSRPALAESGNKLPPKKLGTPPKRLHQLKPPAD
ncbi:hypothetical protein MRX96_025816 [Rhipicephalus microplus]